MLRAAIYGIGRWGARLVDSVQGKSAKIRFVKGITRDTGRGKSGIPLTASYEDALRDPDVDAIVLATPHSQHHAQIVQAAHAGKHVFVEKPFTLTRASAESAVEACRSAGITLAVGFNRRHAPAFVELARRVRSGEVGEVLHIEGHNSGPTALHMAPSSWRASRAESPGGAMTGRGVHTLDAMIQLAGTVTSVHATSERRAVSVDVDDTTAMLLRFSSGITGYLGTIYATADFWRIHVFGTKGWIETRGDTDLTVCGLSGASTRIAVKGVDTERAELEAFADAVAAKQPFLVPPAEIVNGVAVLEAVVESAARGQPVAVA